MELRGKPKNVYEDIDDNLKKDGSEGSERKDGKKEKSLGNKVVKGNLSNQLTKMVTPSFPSFLSQKN